MQFYKRVCGINMMTVVR